MNRVRTADDFKAIRLSLEELRCERAQAYAGATAAKSPLPEDEASHPPSPSADKRYPPIRRHPGSV